VCGGLEGACVSTQLLHWVRVVVEGVVFWRLSGCWSVVWVLAMRVDLVDSHWRLCLMLSIPDQELVTSFVHEITALCTLVITFCLHPLLCHCLQAARPLQDTLTNPPDCHRHNRVA
jgi:hypothetical protein